MEKTMNEMTPPRTRTRLAATPSTPTSAPIEGDGDTSWMATGDTIDSMFEKEERRKAEAAEERARRVYTPWRFVLGVKGMRNRRTGVVESGEADIVILDAKLAPVIKEHEKFDKATGKYTWESCPGDWENCPICDNPEKHDFKRSYPVMFLTIIDWRVVHIPAKGDRPARTIEYQKRLLPVKQADYGYFKRQLQRHGTLRGMHLMAVREGEKTARTGKFEFVEMMSEEDLVAEFGNEEVKGTDGTVIKQRHDDLRPVEYGKAFPKPRMEDLIARYGGSAPAGSTMDNADGWGEHSPGTAAPASTEAPFEGGVPAPASGARSRPARRSVAEPVVQEDDEIPL
jgi:hypothetical protein